MLNYLLVFLLLLALVGIGVLAMVIDSGVSDKHKKSLAYGLFGLFGVIGVVFMMVEDKSAFVYGDWSSGPKAAKKKQTKHYEVTEKAGEAVEEDVQITRKADPGTLLDDGTAGDGKKSADGMASRCPACPIMVELTGGSSVIGTLFREVGEGGLELGPMQEITLPKFAISKMEITVGQFEAFVKDKGYKPANVCRAGSETISGEAWRRPGFEQGQDSPVVCVSFYDAMEFANYLTQKTGQRYSLPTEAEWEYAGSTPRVPAPTRTIRPAARSSRSRPTSARSARRSAAPCRSAVLRPTSMVSTTPTATRRSWSAPAMTGPI